MFKTRKNERGNAIQKRMRELDREILELRQKCEDNQISLIYAMHQINRLLEEQNEILKSI